MNVAVLGGSNGAFATAAYLSLAGHRVRLWRRAESELASVRDGMTLIVTRCYFKDGRVKLEFALARGKKKHDKRQSLRAKETEREAQQAMRRGRS